jgi:hypothetical protein
MQLKKPLCVNVHASIHINCLYKKLQVIAFWKIPGEYFIFQQVSPWRTNLKYSFYNILPEIYKGKLKKKNTHFCVFHKTGSILCEKILKSCIPALGFSGSTLSSEWKTHSVYLSQLLETKAVTF